MQANSKLEIVDFCYVEFWPKHVCVQRLVSQWWCKPLPVEHCRLLFKVLIWPGIELWANSVSDVVGVNGIKVLLVPTMNQLGRLTSVTEVRQLSLQPVLNLVDLIPTFLLAPQIILTLKRYTTIIQSTQPCILHQSLLQWNTISILQNTDALSGWFLDKLAILISSTMCTS